MNKPPAWLRGPVQGALPMLQPVAHSLLDCAEEVRSTLPGLSPEKIASRPNDAASIAFHVRHAMGSLDRLFTHARGEELSLAQMDVLTQEKERGNDPATPDELIAGFDAAVERAMAQLRATMDRDLVSRRPVRRLPAGKAWFLAPR